MTATPQVLSIPEKMRPVFRLFCEAVTDKPDKFRAAFAILVKQCARQDVGDDGVQLLRMLCEWGAADIATTMLAYLPAAAANLVKSKLNADKAATNAVLDTIRESQAGLKDALTELIHEGKYPHLQALKTVAA